MLLFRSQFFCAAVLFTLLAFATSIGRATSALKVSVITEATVLFDRDGAVVGIQHRWSFDNGYSEMAVQGLDRNGDGIYDRNELAELAKVNIDGLKEFHYFLALEQAGSPIEVEAPGEYWMEKGKQGPLSLTFITPLKSAVRPSSLLLGFHDPSGAIYFLPSPVGDSSVRLGANAPPNCSIRFADGEQREAFAQAKFHSAKHATANSGYIFVVDCPTPAPAVSLGPQRRVALVVGNSSYANAPLLANPRHDAKAMAASLRQLGFAEVIEGYDLGFAALSQELKRFGDLALGAEWAVVYFAGHGIEVGGANYLVPVDAVLARASHVEDEAVLLDRVLAKVADARQLRLVILDACRRNPFVNKMQATGATRSLGRGLARIEPSGGVLVAYAARDGQVAEDGNREHSPFTQALLEYIEQPGLEIGLLFRKVRDAVVKRTAGAQEPFTYGSIPSDELYFRAATK